MIGISLALAATLGAGVWYRWAHPRDVACAIDLEATQQHFHAHVALEGFEVDAGDEVLVHGAPARIPLGSQLTLRSNATVRPASWLKRQWTKLTGGTAFQDLYDVGFEG